MSVCRGPSPYSCTVTLNTALYQRRIVTIWRLSEGAVSKPITTVLEFWFIWGTVVRQWSQERGHPQSRLLEPKLDEQVKEVEVNEWVKSGPLIPNFALSTKQLSPLKYQRHAERTETISVRSSWNSGHHLRCGQTLGECRDTRIALFKCLTGEFRLLLNLNLIL
jgi:hypothetical protein